jgi:virginiamycin B lyase
MKQSATSQARKGRLAIATIFAVMAIVPLAPESAPGAPVKPTLTPLANAARALALTSGPEGDIWFAGHRGSYEFDALPGPPASGIVGKVTPGGALTELSTGVDLKATGIAAGSDGALWVIQEGKPEIVRVSTTGQFSSFPLPTSSAAPTSIAAGPDGALWFTETASDWIGRITTTGAVSQFPLPAGSEATKVIAGSGGDLWVAAPGTDSIDRVEATGGAVTSFPIGGGAKNRPIYLTPGPEGGVYFTQRAKRIGHVAPDGKVDELPLAHPARLISGGPDGVLWFTTATSPGKEGPTSDGIASITPEGHPTHGARACLRECGANLAALTPGPGGTLWFATETRFVYGGGAAGLAAQEEPGLVGSYRPMPPALKMAGSARIAGAEAGLDVDCRRGVAGERCKGRLTLKASTMGGGFRVGSVGFDLYSGQETSVKLHLTRQARRLLRTGPLTATAVSNARLVGGTPNVRLLPAPR